MFKKWREARAEKAEATRRWEERRRRELREQWDDLVNTDGGPEAILTVAGAIFPDAIKRISKSAQDVNDLGKRLQERKSSPTKLHGDLDADLEIEKWRSAKLSALEARVRSGETTAAEADKQRQEINRVADARLR